MKQDNYKACIINEWMKYNVPQLDQNKFCLRQTGFIFLKGLMMTTSQTLQLKKQGLNAQSKNVLNEISIHAQLIFSLVQLIIVRITKSNIGLAFAVQKPYDDHDDFLRKPGLSKSVEYLKAYYERKHKMLYPKPKIVHRREIMLSLTIGVMRSSHGGMIG